MTSVPDDLPDAGELLGVVEELDADNEQLRMKSLDLMRLMEDVVTAQVAGERRIAELEERNLGLEAELVAVHRTKLMRFSAPSRRAYAAVRRRSRSTAVMADHPLETTGCKSMLAGARPRPNDDGGVLHRLDRAARPA